MARLYAMLLGATLVAYWAGLGKGTLAFALPWLAVRVAKAPWQKRNDPPVLAFRPAQLAGATLMLLVLDLATFAGGVWWLGEGARSTRL